MSSYTLQSVLHHLSCLEGFKMYREAGDLIVEANGRKFNAGVYTMEEGVVESYIWHRAHIEAAHLVKSAKITI